jgi:F0F1-type ATP synthase delta subunit
MIELTPLARPYAKALFASALESGNLENMADELKIMAYSIRVKRGDRYH